MNTSSVPERIPIAYEGFGQRTDAIGQYADGHFMAFITGTRNDGLGEICVALFLFDHDGAYVRSDIRHGVLLADADALRASLLGGLRDVTFGDVAIRPFSVEDTGVVWCLVDQTAEFGRPRASLFPLDIMFKPPWDGTYDT